MFRKIRIFLRYTFAWILLVGCVSVIGFILYPLLAEKYASMSLSRAGTIATNPAQVDLLEARFNATVHEKTISFFSTLKSAFSTNTNKKSITYNKDSAGIYRGE